MSRAALAVPVSHAPLSPTPRPWLPWRIHFDRQRDRPRPVIGAPPQLSADLAAAVAWSLARFQIGEVGEGRVVNDVRRATMPGVDDDYRDALALFIREEGRHAAILAAAVLALGGQLLTTTWSARGFARVRRLGGIRFKLLAMFAAEVIGIGFYGALAERLPAGSLRAALEEIARDERAHLAFHRWFFVLQAPSGWRRALFLVGWFLLAPAAAAVVLWDHRRTLQALGIPRWAMAIRLWALVLDGAR